MIVEKVVPIEIEDLPEKIWKARKHNRTPLRTLCKMAGMSAQNWYMIERGEYKSVPLQTIRNIERVLGTDFGIQG